MDALRGPKDRLTNQQAEVGNRLDDAKLDMGKAIKDNLLRVTNLYAKTGSMSNEELPKIRAYSIHELQHIFQAVKGLEVQLQHSLSTTVTDASVAETERNTSYRLDGARAMTSLNAGL